MESGETSKVTNFLAVKVSRNWSICYLISYLLHD